MHGKKTRFIVFGISLGVVFSLGFFLGSGGNTQAILLLSGPEPLPKSVDFDPVWKAWKVLEEKYVPADTESLVTPQDRVWGLIQGLAGSYHDPYTVFLPPQQAKSFEEELRGSFGGVGIEMGMRDSVLTVIAPLKGTPADEAGIRAGDLIVEIDEQSTKNMLIDDAVELIRGNVGTVVTFTIAREGEREFLSIPVTRGIIEIPTLDYEVLENDIHSIALYNFGGTAVQEMQTALRAFKSSGDTKLLIDLRGNPGGYLSAAVDMASWFLPLGKVVVIEEFGDVREPTAHRSRGRDIAEPDWRIAILIDGGSASASEILAGALKEHGKAVLIGEQTFGKGSVQELVEITPDTSLKVTVAQWHTPNGVSISASGLQPDVEVARSSEDIEAEKDPQKEAAIRYLHTGELFPLDVVTEEESLEALEDMEKVE